MLKKCLYLIIFVCFLIGSTKPSINSLGRFLEKEEGMVYIQGGTFLLGQSDTDSVLTMFSQLSDDEKNVSITSFYIDKHEVTNREYREFVKWVRDSIAITHYMNDDQFFLPAKGNADRLIDWTKVKGGKVLWNTKDEAVKEKLQGMFYQGDDRIFGKDEMDVSLLKYQFEYFDLKAAAENRYKNLPRSSFIIRDTVSIYPDTLAWISDFEYAQNEALAQNYFSHPAYDEYPVIGITWKQANAFNHWRSKMLEKRFKDTKFQGGLVFQLPTDAQWEYAARAGKKNTRYPWGNELCDEEDCMNANFKAANGNYMNGKSNVIVGVNSYEPNAFGLYNMAGNVAEWTSTSFDESANTFVHDLNPNYSYDAQSGDAEVLKRKVVRGGSWKDSEYFLRNSTRTYEYQDSAKSYIGFRSIVVVPGKLSKNNKK